MAKVANVLLIEDYVGYVDILQDVLSDETDPSFKIECKTTLKGGMERLTQGQVDLVLLDLALPDSHGIDTFLAVHKQSPALPIVILTGLDDQKVALEAVRKGAQDYIVKGSVDAKALAGIMRYAMERKRSEGALKKVHSQTEQLLSSITSILIGVSSEGLIRHWNVVAENTFGIASSEILNRPFAESGIRWDSSRVLASIEECRKENRPIRLDNVRFERSDGQERFLGFTLIPIKGDKGETTEFLLFGADVTARRQVEELKNEFVAAVSHEFRTPLTVIKEGVSQILEGVCGETTQAQKDTLSLCLEFIDRLSRIIEDLLDISKLEAGKMKLKRELVDLVGLAQKGVSAFQSRARNKGLEMRLKTSQNSLEVYADRDKIAQVFTNLISNALKFTEKGFIEISVATKESSVECCVSDTGRGIAKEDMPKVFSKFEQFAREIGPGEKGTGLGLVICKGLVEAHQGKIWVESKIGEGTQVFFTLPKDAVVQFRGSVTYPLWRENG